MDVLLNASMSSQRRKAPIGILGVALILLTVFVGAHILGSTSSRIEGASSRGLSHPSDEVITAAGSSLVPMIENDSQFQALEDGVSYHVNQYSSFGYQSSPGAAPVETVLFYSANNKGEIEVDVNLSNDSILHMYYDNITELGYSFA